MEEQHPTTGGRGGPEQKRIFIVARALAPRRAFWRVGWSTGRGRGEGIREVAEADETRAGVASACHRVMPHVRTMRHVEVSPHQSDLARVIVHPHSRVGVEAVGDGPALAKAPRARGVSGGVEGHGA